LAFASATLPAIGQQSAPPAAQFVKKAAISGLFEIETSRLALDKSKNPDVVKFAQTMISDHGDVNNSLKMTSRSSGAGDDLPMALDAEHRALLDDMRQKSGSDFDAAYVSAQSRAH